MTTEFDLTCATCGSPLSRKSVSVDRLGFRNVGSVDVAACRNCGDQYFPESTLERLR
ncbi:hypothetical protein [Haladaptatus caseinilyticus]|uniref:hypothetical protein n=1 Tax=Haladaptatus caseinilyticus TaxID=2993314 RepID=UPI00224B724D|nr:hypothetical protein [Haladaptatus caseinilyticus]